MCGLVVHHQTGTRHQTGPCASWGVGVLRHHRIPPLRRPTSTDHSVLWRAACRRRRTPPRRRRRRRRAPFIYKGTPPAGGSHLAAEALAEATASVSTTPALAKQHLRPPAAQPSRCPAAQRSSCRRRPRTGHSGQTAPSIARCPGSCPAAQRSSCRRPAVAAYSPGGCTSARSRRPRTELN
jgi:hypothetical protein